MDVLIVSRVSLACHSLRNSKSSYSSLLSIMQSSDRWPRSGQSVASIWNLETWEKDPKTSRDTWDILRQSKAWESHLKHCSGGWSWLCILLSSVTWLQLALQALFASLCLNWECLYTQPINSFTTEASQNLYLLLMSKPLLLHFLLQWKNPLQYGSSHLMYLWAPDPRPSPGASSELVPGISVDQMRPRGKKKKKKKILKFRPQGFERKLPGSRNCVCHERRHCVYWFGFSGLEQGAWVPHLFSSVILNSCSEVNSRWSAYNPFSK